MSLNGTFFTHPLPPLWCSDKPHPKPLIKERDLKLPSFHTAKRW